LYIPFYYFSPMLLPDTLCIVLFTVLLFVLARFDSYRSLLHIILMNVIIGWMIYLRPNLIVLYLPVLIFIWYPATTRLDKRGIIFTLVSVALLVLMIVPWSLFLSGQNRRFVLLGTNQGINLYLGIGARSGGSYSADKESLPEKVADSFRLYEQSNSPDLYRLPQDMENWETNWKLDRLYQEIAVNAWIDRPVALSTYGFSKILHSFGFSLRDIRDLTLVLHFIASMCLSVYIWRVDRYKKWCLFFWTVFFIVVLHAFIFPENQRYKTVLFDVPAILIIVAGSLVLLQKFAKRLPYTANAV
jgi:hypothetical protein